MKMTVAKLIEELQRVEDKDKEVRVLSARDKDDSIQNEIQIGVFVGFVEIFASVEE